MKRIFLFLLLIIPFSVMADTVKLDCPDEITSGQEFTCSIEGYTDKVVTAISMKARFGSNLKMISFVPDNKLLGDGAGGDIQLYTEEDIVNNFKIGTLKLRNDSGSNNSVIIDNIILYYDDDSSLEINSITKNIRIKSVINSSSTSSENVDKKADNVKGNDIEGKTDSNSEDNTDVDIDDSLLNGNTYLIDINIDNYDIYFDKDIFEYELTINDEDKLNIEPVLMDSSSKYVINGNSKLKNGSVIEIKVTAENGDTKAYKIEINKEDKGNNIYKIVFIGIILILVIINIIRIVSRRKK